MFLMSSVASKAGAAAVSWVGGGGAQTVPPPCGFDRDRGVADGGDAGETLFSPYSYVRTGELLHAVAVSCTRYALIRASKPQLKLSVPLGGADAYETVIFVASTPDI
jgi:hypothetical protein